LPSRCRAPVVVSADEASGSSTADLAKKLRQSRLVADQRAIPIQYDGNIGPADDGERVTLNIQPVVPVSLNDEWRLISRTILPVIYQDDIFPARAARAASATSRQSVFFSPQEPGASGVIWGAGPVLLVPTASDDLLGTGKWGAGPTFILLKQSGHVTYGALANHIWSFAGEW
jgi:hypothetical protein